ncbi:MAG: hypothetical protein V3U52_08475 [Thermoplasmata archaeon]
MVGMITPEMIEEMVEQKVREILEEKEVWKTGLRTTPASNDSRT